MRNIVPGQPPLPQDNEKDCQELLYRPYTRIELKSSPYPGKRVVVEEGINWLYNPIPYRGLGVR